LRLELVGTEDSGTNDPSFLLTTETPESQTTRLMIATRPKPEASAIKLRVGERVVVALNSFTVLPAGEPKSS
jgi:hypothetical protein